MVKANTLIYDQSQAGWYPQYVRKLNYSILTLFYTIRKDLASLISVKAATS